MAEGIGGGRNEVSVAVITFPRDGHTEHHNEAVAQRLAELIAEVNTPPPPFSCVLYLLVDVAVEELTIQVMELERELRASVEKLALAESEKGAEEVAAAIEARLDALSAELEKRHEAADAELTRLKRERDDRQQSTNPMEALIQALSDGAGDGVTVIGPGGPMALGDLEDLGEGDPDLDAIFADAGLDDKDEG